MLHFAVRVMRKIIILIAIFAGAFFLASCSSMMKGMMKNKMFKHYESKIDFDETYSKMKKYFEDSEYWVILGEYDNIERYGEYGRLQPYKVIEACSPKPAVKILNDDENKHFGAFIPMKVLVYEKSDGKTYVSHMNTGMMGDMFDDEFVVEHITKASREMSVFMEKEIGEEE